MSVFLAYLRYGDLMLLSEGRKGHRELSLIKFAKNKNVVFYSQLTSSTDSSNFFLSSADKLNSGLFNFSSIIWAYLRMEQLKQGELANNVVDLNSIRKEATHVGIASGGGTSGISGYIVTSGSSFGYEVHKSSQYTRG